ncbi:hypothetical protein BDZ91DRAFT_58058 [Kalaharituber pfeilii]|nr:hypothetical protein BDZ91DRAFT_58058 [Kalaharituber pfeilii]
MERRNSSKSSRSLKWFGRKDSTSTKLTPEQKRRTRITTMSDPTRAITEEEPFAVSQAKTGEGIRTYQHKDIYGNPILEPDLSNPTRSRWERPLETIRSFEAQINRDLQRQSAFSAVDAVDNMDQSQRQVQHNPGPFDSSLYHRNNGAQRYAPVDAYRSHNGYYQHRQMSQDRYPPVEQVPPMPQSNGYGHYPDHQISKMHHVPRRPADAYHNFGPPGTPGSGQDHYNYNSDLNNSESSSFGSNITPANDYDMQFSFNDNMPSLQLGASQQLDGQGYDPGSGTSRNASPRVVGVSSNPYLNNGGYGNQSNNPFMNQEHSYAGDQQNGSFNGESAGQNGMNGQQSPFSQAAQPTTALSSPPAGPVNGTPAPKKKGFLQRISRG